MSRTMAASSDGKPAHQAAQAGHVLLRGQPLDVVLERAQAVVALPMVEDEVLAEARGLLGVARPLLRRRRVVEGEVAQRVAGGEEGLEHPAGLGVLAEGELRPAVEVAEAVPRVQVGLAVADGLEVGVERRPVAGGHEGREPVRPLGEGAALGAGGLAGGAGAPGMDRGAAPRRAPSDHRERDREQGERDSADAPRPLRPEARPAGPSFDGNGRRGRARGYRGIGDVFKGATTCPKPRKGKDAITLLKEDHKKVKGLLAQLEKTTERGADRRRKLLGQIEGEIKVQTHDIEEERSSIPRYRDAVTQEGRPRAVPGGPGGSTTSSTSLFPSSRHSDPAGEIFGAKAKVLKELIEHHAEEEEKEMFPRARKVLGAAELRELGSRMASRKRALKGRRARCGRGRPLAAGEAGLDPHPVPHAVRARLQPALRELDVHVLLLDAHRRGQPGGQADGAEQLLRQLHDEPGVDERVELRHHLVGVEADPAALDRVLGVDGAADRRPRRRAQDGMDPETVVERRHRPQVVGARRPW